MWLHELLDKLLTETDHLERIMADDEISDQRVELALSVAKRVRRQSTILIRALADERDNKL